MAARCLAWHPASRRAHRRHMFTCNEYVIEDALDTYPKRFALAPERL
jgi:hypothetical protein